LVLVVPSSDGLSHDALNIDVDDHHPRPKQVTIDETSQVIAGMSTYDLDVPLGSSGYRMAFVQAMGPRRIFFSNRGREGTDLILTRSSSEGTGTSYRDTGSGRKHYSAAFNKAAGDAFLSFKIYDSLTGTGQLYISIQSAWLNGSDLRIRFYNHASSNKTLWVKGQAQVY